MSMATEDTKEQYEKQLLLSEEALTLLDPNSIRIEEAYYEHGFDRFTFTIKSLEYSIPACFPTLPTLYFVGFNRPAASEIYANFQAVDILNSNAYFKFEKIARDYLVEKFSDIWFNEFQPKTTREALDYVGLSDKAQTNLLKLKYPPTSQRVEFMLRHVINDELGDWVLRYFDRRFRTLTRLDYEIKKREITDAGGNLVPVDLQFLADELENKYMDSEFAYGNDFRNDLPLKLITDLP